jgi:hypothetical protein
VAAGSGVVAVALILSLPGGAKGSAPRLTDSAQEPARQPSVQRAGVDTAGARMAQTVPAAESVGRTATRSQDTQPRETPGESGSAAGGAQSIGAGAAGGRAAGSSADESSRGAISQILELRAHRHALETGAASAAGSGPAAYTTEPVVTADQGQQLAAPAARPSARARPEFGGPVESRLLARYSALREAGP